LILLKPVKLAMRNATRLIRWLPVPEALWIKLDLLKTLVQRDLEARYKGSVLGNSWALLNQLAQLLVYTYLFSIVLKVKLSLNGLPDNGFTFGLWLFAGLIPWTAFISGFSQSAVAVINQPNLVKKVVFPLGLLPLVAIGSAFVESSMGLMLLITFVAFSAHVIHPTLLLLPLVWMPQLLLATGLGYLVSSLTVFLRDIPQTIGVILNLWFYVTPIVYPVSAIPEGFRFWVLWFNPMTIVVELYRDLVLVGEMRHWMEWGILSLISGVIFAIGLGIYRRLRPAFADVL
jgi:lipopolysaccharide transport system permease protein